MKINRTTDTMKGPGDWFTGDVYIDAITSPDETPIGAALVHFTPGARTAWHTHPHGQTIHVTEGAGLCQREGGAVEEIRPGDRVLVRPGDRAPADGVRTSIRTRRVRPWPMNDGDDGALRPTVDPMPGRSPRQPRSVPPSWRPTAKA